MFVKNVQTGNLIEAEIVRLEEEDFKLINRKDSQFKKFKWKKVDGEEYYKLKQKQSDIILGLMSIIDHLDPAVDAIEIKLLEVSRQNTGRSKQIDFIAGCLIAFACRISFYRGHNGFTYLTPKTYLIEHYVTRYGFTYFPPMSMNLEGLMIVNDRTAIKLINQYLDRMC